MPANAKSLDRILDVGKRMLGGFDIAASVGDWGAGATNDPEDVRTVQLLLEHEAKRTGRPELDPRGVDGKISTVPGRSATVRAINTFQRGFMSKPDGVVQPDGTTIKKLKEGLAAGAPAASRSAIQTGRAGDGFPSWMHDLLSAVSRGTSEVEPPVWIGVASAERGVTEVEGEEHNARVIEYQKSTTNTGKRDTAYKNRKGKLIAAWTDDRVDPWCSSFVNWTLKQSSYEGTNSTSSHSWKDWGDGYSRPILGSIAFIDWGAINPAKHGKGHVGFVVGQTPETKKRKSRIIPLGGNQGGKSVRYSAFNRDYIVSFRVPKSFVVDSKLYNLPTMNIDSKGETYEDTR